MPPSLILGGYRVVRALGRGSMGVVYEATETATGRRAALKTLSTELARDPGLRERFVREARVGMALHHPNIVEVYEAGEANGQPYLAMEYLDGTDLEKLLRETELSLEWKLDLLRQICEGLGHAHEHGIVHRDVKPGNVWVKPGGDLKLVDFGLARVSHSTLTERGVVLGSVHYIAPEQIEGGPVDHRADIFSVGAVAYEMLAGRRPFEGTTLTSVMLRITQGPPDASALPPSPYSPRLEAIVMRALATKSVDRYDSLADMRRDLRGVVERRVAALVAAGLPAGS
jgi:serine/threonine-protein kinase